MSWTKENSLDCFDEDLISTKEYEIVVAETKKAILFKDVKGKFWMPKSVIIEYNEKLKYFTYILYSNLKITYLIQFIN